MSSILTAERVSRDASDNFVFRRSVLAYREAARMVRGDVLEIGTGTGYGAEIIAPCARSFITVDKTVPEGWMPQQANVEFRRAAVPPLPFSSGMFDCVVSFQVIEHIKRDTEFVNEVWRVLRPGGLFIVTTPNAPMSLTRNPWHVREYEAPQLEALLRCRFDEVQMLGIEGNDKVAQYYENNRRSVEKIARWDILDLQHRLPAPLLRLPYDILNRINRRRLRKADTELTDSITEDDYRLVPVSQRCYDLFFTARKGAE